MEPNTRYRFTKETHVSNGKTFPAGHEFRTDSVIQFPFIVENFGNSRESRTINQYILESWLEDGRIEVMAAWVPAIGDTFFKFNGYGRIETMTRDSEDDRFVSFGNYFQTEAEAAEVRDLVRESLLAGHEVA